jgi:iron-sulfur cluster repair protein YtfE (RIC family)
MIGGERLSSLESMLAGDHVRLDRAFQAIVTRAYGGDYQQLEGEWVTFERALQQHLDAEERTLIPALAQDRPGEARVLLEEHARMRVTVLQLGVELDLHCLRAERVEAFVESLHAHALREENIFYPWVDRQLGA